MDSVTDSEIILIDLSSIAHPIWHMSQADPDPNKTCQQVVARVRAIASGRRSVAICCDAGRSFRKDLAPSYKANRPESDATLQHQIRLACEQLQADGFPVWAVKGFEADDLIASAVTTILATPELTALVVSADKDLLQLVGPRVRQMKPDSGNVLDAALVVEKFCVKPEQVRDYLTLVGDASDNIKGAKDIGPKKAAALLQKYGSIEAVYVDLYAHPTAFTPALATSLKEFESRLPETRDLVTLKTDVPIPFEELAAERVPREVATFGDFAEEDDMETPDLQQPTAERAQPRDAATRVDAAQEKVTDLPGNDAPPADASSASRLNPAAPTALAIPSDVLAPAPPEWELQLDPRSMRDARLLAKDMHDSRMFSAYGTPQAVLSTVMLGRELGLPAMASLRQVHIVEGRHALSADLMVALILKSGLAEFFEPVEFTDQRAVWETKRKGARQPFRLEHTIEMARTAGLLKDKSNWLKVPIDMLNARAKSRLARLIYPDVVGGLYTPDELDELRLTVQAA